MYDQGLLLNSNYQDATHFNHPPDMFAGSFTQVVSEVQLSKVLNHCQADTEIDWIVLKSYVADRNWKHLTNSVCTVLNISKLVLHSVSRICCYDAFFNLQAFSETLLEKTHELSNEKKRSDKLLYQMLPPTVAQQLRQRKQVIPGGGQHVPIGWLVWQHVDGEGDRKMFLSPTPWR